MTRSQKENQSVDNVIALTTNHKTGEVNFLVNTIGEKITFSSLNPNTTNLNNQGGQEYESSWTEVTA